MKKLFSLMAFAAILFALTACTDSATPTGVFEQAVKAAQDKDFKKFAEYLYVGDETPEKQQAAREQFADMLETKSEQAEKKENTINPMKVISEEISEDGQTAKIKYEETKPDGSIEEGIQNMRKDADGNWKLDIGK